MDQVQIPIEKDEVNWRGRCYGRVERLKEKECPSSDPAILLLQDEELLKDKNSIASELRLAVRNGNVDGFVDVLEKLSYEKELILSVILDQFITPVGNSLLHEAAYFGKTDIAELIVHHFPVLLTKTNIKGDTPLHVAARSQSLDVIKVFLSACHEYNLEKEQEPMITRLTNTYGNTALHEAVIYNSDHVDIVILLFEADKFVAHYLNKSGKSPLFLAVSNSIKEIVHILLRAPCPDNKSLPMSHGNSPLHAAIYTYNADLMQEIATRSPHTMYIRDENGGTPLHYAASTGYLEGVRILSHASALTAMQWNAKGHLPIHLACKEGHIKVVEELLRLEGGDDSIWINKKGQNILHVAAKRGQLCIVNYILKSSKLNINEQDNYGNTPLHLAAQNLFPDILLSLTQDRRINVRMLNNEGLTARDVLEVQLRTKMSTFIQWLSVTVLSSAGARATGKARRMIEKDKVEVNEEWVKNRTDTLMLVTVLIATVTFAAGLTVPGGVYGPDDPNPPNRGNAIFVKRRMFQIFVLSNTTALYTSTFGTFILLGAQLGDYRLAQRIFGLVFNMVALGLLTMTLAFVAAVRLIVTNLSWLANLITVFGFTVSSIILFFYILAVFPIAIEMPILRHVSHLIVRIYIAISAPKSRVEKL